MNNIPFNKPYLTGNEISYIIDSVKSGKISGNGKYTALCHAFFEKRYGFKKCLLTNSCTDALEMAALLLNIMPGDEVIMPSYTFVSTANAFVLRGAKIVFVDSALDNPNMDLDLIRDLITSRTKAIVVVHYGGVSFDMDILLHIAHEFNLFIVEDAAQAVDSFYIDKNQVKRPLGSIGHLAAFSFHETKNVISGEGGMLVINDESFIERAEVIWEKGTNRSAFFRGEVDKYNWIDIGSSYLPSDMIAAFLFAQLETIDLIQSRRKEIWNYYFENLQFLEQKKFAKLPFIPSHATNNAHLFYLVLKSTELRSLLIDKLKKKSIHAVFHYQSLHQSPYYNSKHDGRSLPNSETYSNCLLRLPIYFELSENEQALIIDVIKDVVEQY